MAKLIAESHYDIGGYREVYEDRVRAQAIKTAGGVHLTVAAVADGVGGENKGERAAQTALDALYGYLEKSKEKDAPTLLTQAVQFANKAVFQLQRETGGASTTLAVALVSESTDKLFIANVGDSRIYLCRNQKLTQLTIDHSWATVMVWQGKVSPEAARDHPRANILMRALGMKEQIDVDLGFYVGTTAYEEANSRGKEGLPLQDGDSVLVCSDGLIKDSPKSGEVLIKTEEIVRTLSEKEGKKAAQELVSFALGRGPDDNISAALIQMPDRWRSWKARRPLVMAGLVIIGLAAVLGLLVFILAGYIKQNKLLNANQTATAEMAFLVGSYTPTPSNTPAPSNTALPSQTPQLLPSQTPQPAIQVVALVLSGTVEYKNEAEALYKPLEEGAPVFGQTDLTVQTKGDSSAKLRMSDGSFLYLGKDTSLTIQFIADPAPEGSYVIALEGGILLVDAEHFATRTSAGHSAEVTKGLMGVRYNAVESFYSIDCLEGSCTASLPDQTPITLSTDQSIGSVDWKIASAQCLTWINIAGDRVKCPQTPTPTATSTPTVNLTWSPAPTYNEVSTVTPTKVKPRPTRTQAAPKNTNTQTQVP